MSSVRSGTKNPVVACLGLAFKGGTDDCRESPAIQIIAGLIAQQVQVAVFDPKAMDNAKKILGDAVRYVPDMYAVAEGADVLVTLTEWDEFKTLDLNKIRSYMRTPRLVDLRRCFTESAAQAAGFEYHKIG